MGNAINYSIVHAIAPPGVGIVTLAEDFGEGGAPVPEPNDELEQAISELEQVIALQDDARYVQRGVDEEAVYREFGEASRITGIVRERLVGLRPKVPMPPPPPPRLSGVYGSYPGHGLAVDLYGGMTDEQVKWGPHHGLPLIAPADGRVEVYQFGTPLGRQVLKRLAEYNGVPADIYAANHDALSADWTCWAADPLQTMYVAVWWPSAPYIVEGQRIGHLHYGHDHPNIKAGPIKKDERFGITWDSGIRFEPSVPNARAAHTHCCAGAGSTLSPNGDLPGRLAAVAQGWALTPVGSVPGPTDYMSGRYCAGRLLRDFEENGRPIPPLP